LRRKDPKFQEPRFSQYLAAVAALDRYGGASAMALRYLRLRYGGCLARATPSRCGERVARPSLTRLTTRLGLEARRRGEAAYRTRSCSRIVKDPIGPEFMAPPQAGAMAGALPTSVGSLSGGYGYSRNRDRAAAKLPGHRRGRPIRLTLHAPRHAMTGPYDGCNHPLRPNVLAIDDDARYAAG